MKRPMIYVAGPIATGGDIPGNTHRGVRAAEELRRQGFITFCPHLSVITEIVCGPRPWEDWLEYDEEVILRCDAIYRMAGESRGADREEAFAKSHGIPVFRAEKELLEWRDTWVARHSEKSVLDRLQLEIGAWGDRTFPQSTPRSVLAHFKKESKELIDDETAVEAADCLMLLLHFAHKMGFSLRDQVRQKFEVNKGRVWGKPDADGVVEHVRS
jgi:hypothetical protein